ncbi:Hypothetical protein, putative [Bodo saltans]|uniref:Calpain catalytic domain-containing protein n=1 Tax=Bodo saltans TaxID=75058 RepID=A0A0S4J6I7_BODSA|nr:Hypothetical protein, putative [Bodo saltans]|eukprot:CUG86079.1 Hypothetical protein, putative [Bodo saltans]
MYFDQDASPAERRMAFGLAPAPDATFAADWDHMGVTSQLVDLRAPYTTHLHPTANEQQTEVLLTSSRHASTTTKLLDHRAEERIEIERERARRNGETYREAPQINKDFIFGGPDFLYREPRVQNKPQQFVKSSFPIPRSASSRDQMLHRNMSAGLLSDDRARCVRDCRRALEEALHSHPSLEGKRLFVDTSFFVGSRAAQYAEGTPVDASVAEPRDVCRLTQLFPEALVFDPDPPQYTLVSTTSRLHHIVAAMEVVRRTPERLMEAIVTTDPKVPAQDFLFDHGMIGVVVFIDGRWEWTIIDDLIAVDDRKQPLHLATVKWDEVCALEERYGCTHSKGDKRRPISWDPPQILELWPLLVLKAFAKTLGSYSALDNGSTISDAVVMMTGDVPMPHRCLSAAYSGEDLSQVLTESQTSYTLIYPRRSGNTATYPGLEFQCPNLLPCILTSIQDFVSSVYCPWGTMKKAVQPRRRHDAPIVEVHYHVELPTDALHIFFERIETFMVPPPSHPQLSVSGVMAPDVPTRLALNISTAVCTELLLCLEQSDPKVQAHLPFSVRRALPFGCISWRVTSTASGAVVAGRSEEVCRQLALHTSMEPGSYAIEILLTMAPSIPFQFTISAPATAVLTLSRGSMDPEVHGVCTRFLQASSLALEEASSCGAFGDRDLEYSPSKKMLSDVLTRRASRLIKPTIAAEVKNAFTDGDILQRGALGEDAAHRALLSLILKGTPGGEAFLQHVHNASSSGGISLAAFNEAIQAATTAGGFSIGQSE